MSPSAIPVKFGGSGIQCTGSNLGHNYSFVVTVERTKLSHFMQDRGSSEYMVTEREAFIGIQSLPGPCPKCGEGRFGTERCEKCGFQELDDPHWPYEIWCPVCKSEVKEPQEQVYADLNIYKFHCPDCGHEFLSEYYEKVK